MWHDLLSFVLALEGMAGEQRQNQWLIISCGVKYGYMKEQYTYCEEVMWHDLLSFVLALEGLLNETIKEHLHLPVPPSLSLPLSRVMGGHMGYIKCVTNKPAEYA